MFSYPVGINLQYQLRLEAEANRLATYEMLRFFAQSCDVVRILIENRKNLLRQVKYSWKLRYVNPTDQEKLSLTDPRIQFLTRFFAMPDRTHDINFDSWLNMLLDDMLVVDAPTIYVQRNLKGEPISLMPVDGTTIKPLIGPDGGSPEPPAPAYQQISHGVPIANLDRNELVYFPKNPRMDSLYGYGPVEQIVMSVNLFLRRQVSQLQFYTESNEPKGFLTLPPEWSNEEQLKAFQGMLNALLSGNMPERQRVMVVPNGSQYHDIKREALVDQFDMWLAQVACFSFGVSPMPFLYMRTNRATAESARRQALEEGLGPYIRWVETFMTYLVYKAFGWNDIECDATNDALTDDKTRLEMHQAYVDMGVYSVNEVRGDLNRSNLTGGDGHFRTVGNQLIPVGQEEQVLSGGELTEQEAEQAESSEEEGGGGSTAVNMVLKKKNRTRRRSFTKRHRRVLKSAVL